MSPLAELCGVNEDPHTLSPQVLYDRDPALLSIRGLIDS